MAPTLACIFIAYCGDGGGLALCRAAPRATQRPQASLLGRWRPPQRPGGARLGSRGGRSADEREDIHNDNASYVSSSGRSSAHPHAVPHSPIRYTTEVMFYDSPQLPRVNCRGRRVAHVARRPPVQNRSIRPSSARADGVASQLRTAWSLKVESIWSHSSQCDECDRLLAVFWLERVRD